MKTRRGRRQVTETSRRKTGRAQAESVVGTEWGTGRVHNPLSGVRRQGRSPGQRQSRQVGDRHGRYQGISPDNAGEASTDDMELSDAE